MIFRYWRSGPRLLPLIPISVFSTQEPLETLALADTGSDYNVAGSDIARRLGINLERAKSVTVAGVGNAKETGKMAQASYKIGQYTWSAPTVFLSSLGERVILGQTGFFAFFNVDFR